MRSDLLLPLSDPCRIQEQTLRQYIPDLSFASGTVSLYKARKSLQESKTLAHLQSYT